MEEPAPDDRTHVPFLILEARMRDSTGRFVPDKRKGYRGGSAIVNPEKVARYSAAVVKSANDKCDAIVQERVWLSLLGWDQLAPLFRNAM